MLAELMSMILKCGHIGLRLAVQVISVKFSKLFILLINRSFLNALHGQGILLAYYWEVNPEGLDLVAN